MAKSGISLKAIAIVAIGLLVTVFVGIFVAFFGATVGEHYGILIALPVTMIIGFLFFFDRYFLFLLIIIFRSAIDVALENTRFGNFGLGAVLNGLVILIALIAMIERPEPVRRVVKQTWLPFLIITFIAVIISPTPLPAIKIFLVLLSYASVFAVAIAIIKNEDDYAHWMRAVFYSSFIPVAYAFIDIAHGGAVRQESEGFRISSTFSHPNAFAFYLVLMISLSFYFYKSKEFKIPVFLRRTLPVYISVMLSLLILTKTRSAWASCFAFFAIYAFLYERKYLTFVFLAPVIAFMIPSVRDRFMDLAQGNEIVNYSQLNSYAWRKLLWLSSIQFMDFNRYLFGYGLEAFKHYSLDFFALAGGKERPAHSVYVQLFFDAGAFGLLTFIWLHARVGQLLMRFYMQNKLMIFSAIMFLLEFALNAYSDNMLAILSYDWYLWFILGAAYAVNYSKQQSKQKQDETENSLQGV